ncbi:hypothetical protein BC332_06744 [Capsicum chinense]|nr:hypothetical protein BC332_06744 [Capsicum chinense]
MTAGSLPSDDFDDFNTPPPIEIITKSKAMSDRLLVPPSKRRKRDPEQKKFVTVQKRIKAPSFVKEVNVSPPDASKLFIDPINEQAQDEPSLMDCGEQMPPFVSHIREFTQKINVSGGMHHEQVLLKVDMDAIESFVKTYVDKKFDHIEALMKKHHEEMKKQHGEMTSIVKEKHDAPQKNETDGDELKTPKEQPKDITDKNDDANAGSTGDRKLDEKINVEPSQKFIFDDSAIPTETIEVQHEQKKFIDNIITKIFLPVITIKSIELSQKVSLPDSSLPTDNIEVQMNRSTEISIDEFQESIDNIIAEISTLIVAIKSVELSEKVNISDPPLPIDNIEVQNEPQVYDLMLSSRHRKPSHEIHKLSVMLSTYLCDNEFLENTKRTVWSSLEAYIDKISQDSGAVNQNLFDIEYVEDIAQQASESL